MDELHASISLIPCDLQFRTFCECRFARLFVKPWDIKGRMNSNGLHYKNRRCQILTVSALNQTAKQFPCKVYEQCQHQNLQKEIKTLLRVLIIYQNYLRCYSVRNSNSLPGPSGQLIPSHDQEKRGQFDFQISILVLKT